MGFVHGPHPPGRRGQIQPRLASPNLGLRCARCKLAKKRAAGSWVLCSVIEVAHEIDSRIDSRPFVLRMSPVRDQRP